MVLLVFMTWVEACKALVADLCNGIEIGWSRKAVQNERTFELNQTQAEYTRNAQHTERFRPKPAEE